MGLLLFTVVIESNRVMPDIKRLLPTPSAPLMGTGNGYGEGSVTNSNYSHILCSTIELVA